MCTDVPPAQCQLATVCTADQPYGEHEHDGEHHPAHAAKPDRPGRSRWHAGVPTPNRHARRHHPPGERQHQREDEQHDDPRPRRRPRQLCIKRSLDRQRRHASVAIGRICHCDPVITFRFTHTDRPPDRSRDRVGGVDHRARPVTAGFAGFSLGVDEDPHRVHVRPPPGGVTKPNTRHQLCHRTVAAAPAVPRVLRAVHADVANIGGVVPDMTREVRLQPRHLGLGTVG